MKRRAQNQKRKVNVSEEYLRWWWWFEKQLLVDLMGLTRPIKYLEIFAFKWLTSLFNNICISASLLPEFKKLSNRNFKKRELLRKASSYRPITLLSVCYKILERLMYQHISPIVEDLFLFDQVRLSQQRSCRDKALALGDHIENGFEKWYCFFGSLCVM